MLRLFSRRFALALPFALLLAACQNTPPQRPQFADLTFRHLSAWRFDVARVEVKDSYAAPLRAPNVEHEMSVPPARAAANWANARLQAVGGGFRTVEFVIKNAAVTEANLNRTQGLRGMFTTDQTERYDAVLDVELIVRGERGFQEASARAEARRSITMPENATLNQREETWFRLTEQLMADINAEMERSVPTAMGRYLR